MSRDIHSADSEVHKESLLAGAETKVNKAHFRNAMQGDYDRQMMKSRLSDKIPG